MKEMENTYYNSLFKQELLEMYNKQKNMWDEFLSKYNIKNEEKKSTVEVLKENNFQDIKNISKRIDERIKSYDDITQFPTL